MYVFWGVGWKPHLNYNFVLIGFTILEMMNKNLVFGINIYLCQP